MTSTLLRSESHTSNVTFKDNLSNFLLFNCSFIQIMSLKLISGLFTSFYCILLNSYHVVKESELFGIFCLFSTSSKKMRLPCVNNNLVDFGFIRWYVIKWSLSVHGIYARVLSRTYCPPKVGQY